MRKFGLIGYPLSHTFSPGYFANKFSEFGITDCEYKAYSLDSIERYADMDKTDFVGINVTIPYKEKVIPFLDELSEEALEIGAVNTIHFVKDKSFGYNSDVYGFSQSLINWVGDKLPEKGLILGSGGASKAVSYVCKKLGIDATIVSRKEGYLNYENISKEILDTHYLIVNTTPLGMSPQVDAFPDLNYELLSKHHFCYDLVYNPEITRFMQKARDNGANAKNGYEMLILQAEKSWEIWNT
jgi:shikimate dehydrogenase